MRAKEPVTIRFKELSKGSKSIYLDIYRNGARSYEFLKLYIIPERCAEDKIANAVTMDAANAIKAQRIKEIVNGEAGIKTLQGDSILLLHWMQTQQDKAAQAAEAAGRIGIAYADSIKSARRHLANYIECNYKGRTIYLTDVDKEFCAGFVQYLKNTKKSRITKKGYVEHKSGAKLSANTCNIYYTKLATALNDAYKKGLIISNPATQLEDNHPF